MVESHGAWQCWACPPVLLIDITGAINKEGAIQQVDDIMAGRPPRLPKSASGKTPASGDVPPADAAPTTEATA